jgi:hypothetical protein
MREHPQTTLRRSVLKFFDFWGLERDFIAGVQRGYYDTPLWFAALGALAMTFGYVATAIFAVIGISLAPPERRAHLLLITIVLFICGVHTVVFGHSRYHLPLVPILLLYAASAVSSGRWREVFTFGRPSLLATSMVVLLGIVWLREIFVRDWDRIRSIVAG